MKSIKSFTYFIDLIQMFVKYLKSVKLVSFPVSLHQHTGP